MEIDALIMAGGEGRRLKSLIEKPLVKILGKHLVDYVIEALQKSKINVIYAATSPKAPNTEKYLKEKGITIIRTPGWGYVKDMVYALRFLGLGKTLVISADLPLIKAKDIDWLISEYKKHATPSLCLLVPAYIFEELDIEPSIVLEGNVPAGINIVDGKNLNGPETKLISNRIEFALNVNTKKELKLAERRLKNADQQRTFRNPRLPY
jgi:adenosylcobinamide-phosphate guanylyltransferase